MKLGESDIADLPPIPQDLPTVAGWKDIPIYETNESLTPLGMFSENWQIETSSIYAAEHSNSPYATPDKVLKGSMITQFARKSVADKLHHAQELLPDDYYLVVFDALRTVMVQRSLHRHYFNALLSKHPDWTENDLLTETARYVSMPSEDPTRPATHSTGGSMDLVVIKARPYQAIKLKTINERLHELSLLVPLYPEPEQEANDLLCRERYILQMQRSALLRNHTEILDFGTRFDYGGMEAGLTYFEELKSKQSLTWQEQEASKYRRLLYYVMTQAGFMPYTDEWWHFNDPQTQMGSKMSRKQVAGYGVAKLSADNVQHERMRAMHLKGTRHLYEWDKRSLPGKIHEPLLHRLIQLNQEALTTTGHPSDSALPEALIIEPS